jgi:glycosyltransferase involved in cell wall biosynthesis
MLLSVVIASCNRQNKATDTIKTLIKSGFDEVVIVDDGSIPAYKINIPGCTVISLTHNNGPSAARNIGARQSKTEWLIFLDDDDSLAPNLMERVKLYHDGFTDDYDIIHFGYRKIDLETKGILSESLSTIEDPSILTGSWMMRREFFLGLGGYEEELKYSENTDLIERALVNGARTLHAGFISLDYTVGRPKRREEMADRRALACLFFIKNRPLCDRNKMLKIGLINSWWSKRPSLAIKLLISYFNAQIASNS